MRSPLPDLLDEIVASCGTDTSGGPADYIPELAQVDPDRFALALATVQGQVYSTGDVDDLFTIQSVSKPFAYAFALTDRGPQDVGRHIAVEPSGEAFNELSLEEGSMRPLNPMINAGAITAHWLLGPAGCDEHDRFERVLTGLSALAGRELDVDEEVASSEMSTAHRNLAIAHMLRSYGVITADPEEVVRGYVRQCAVRVTAGDLALMAATLANGGVQPVTGARVLAEDTVRHVLSVMATCGMYDAAGDWFSSVGIPAKSGVSGAILGALPAQVGLATFSPRLDERGTSVRGAAAFERLSAQMGLHLMEIPPPARSVVRSYRVRDTPQGPVQVLDLQGTIRFAGAERVVRLLCEEPPAERRVALDLLDVHSLDETAVRMLAEAARRLREDGHEVWVVATGDEPLPPRGDRPAPDVRVARTVEQVGA